MEDFMFYTTESCHEIGYKWGIEAPKDLTTGDVKLLQEAIVSYTDEPTQRQW
jgi:hypothetical protein